MSTISVNRKHSLPKERVLEILNTLAKAPEAKDISYQWENDKQEKLILKGVGPMTNGSTGTLTIGEDFVQVDLKLAGLASLMSGMVKSHLEKHLDSLLK